ncbi:hypothetical protein C7271_03475 [filamentous cyanobacterium CCP5]|nr:hypothetical protein C7271_03475 [filamentous cyanobacterium CCP5]
MIPAGYMAKRVCPCPDWLQVGTVVDIYSVSPCLSVDFAHYIPYWRHNGYWFFNSPETIRTLAEDHSIDLTGTQLFYYEVYEREYDPVSARWQHFTPEVALSTEVVIPFQKSLEGYDLVSFSGGSCAECSPLSCNRLAADIPTNQHCLLASLQDAQKILEQGQLQGAEPGPYRIFAVFALPTAGDWFKSSV